MVAQQMAAHPPSPLGRTPPTPSHLIFSCRVKLVWSFTKTKIIVVENFIFIFRLSMRPLKYISHLIVSCVRQLHMFETGASQTRSHVGEGPATGCQKPALGQGPTPLSFAVLTSCCCAVLQVCSLCFCRQSVDSSSPAQPSRRNNQHDPALMITVEL
jgi:hypothetical protein